jgi:hypothetical protein
MNAGPENFERLRRLLVLKRYEQPPQGYFVEFPSRVIARIEGLGAQTENGVSKTGLVSLESLQRFWEGLQSTVLCRAAFGAVACALLVIGQGFQSSTMRSSPRSLTGLKLGTLYPAAESPASDEGFSEGVIFRPGTTGVRPSRLPGWVGDGIENGANRFVRPASPLLEAPGDI